MTRVSELLRCPRCARPLAAYDGLGIPAEPELAAWRELLAEHRRVCAAPMTNPPAAVAAP